MSVLLYILSFLSVGRGVIASLATSSWTWLGSGIIGGIILFAIGRMLDLLVEIDERTRQEREARIKAEHATIDAHAPAPAAEASALTPQPRSPQTMRECIPILLRP